MLARPSSNLLALGLLVLPLVAFLSYSLYGETKTIYLPGPTTDGHYQIELACDQCHTDSFADRASMQEACVKCHGAELRAVKDSHPEKKFTDPRNADRVAILDARQCITCHLEHRPERVSSMGLSLPKDYCYHCHAKIAEDRPSHQNLAFDSCAKAGCHNFHDNQALYEDLLIKHLGEPDVLDQPQNPAREPKPRGAAGRPELTLQDADAPPWVKLGAEQLEAWQGDAHAAHAVNCSACHVTDLKAPQQSWRNEVPNQRCGECHDYEHEGYLQGRHGMRERAGLPPLRVADARRVMDADAADKSLTCTACHSAHSFNLRRAAVDACLGCHADQHSRAYLESPHAALWRADPSGRSGASCATCHLPRLAIDGGVRISHQQNDTLRPNEKMVRKICNNCHGLQFSLQALADPMAIGSNFAQASSETLESFAWVSTRASR